MFKIGIMKNIFLFFLFFGVCSCSVNAINPPSGVTEKQLSDDVTFGILPIPNQDWRMNGATEVPRQLPSVARVSE